jgi:hypothetical protein
VTRDDCIAIETDAILILVHRSSTSSRPPHSQQKQQRDTNGPHAGYGERHHSGGCFFSIEAQHISSST